MTGTTEERVAVLEYRIEEQQKEITELRELLIKSLEAHQRTVSLLDGWQGRIRGLEINMDCIKTGVTPWHL